MQIQIDTEKEVKTEAKTKVGHININTMGEEVDIDWKGGVLNIVLVGLEGAEYFRSNISINSIQKRSQENVNKRNHRYIISNLG